MYDLEKVIKELENAPTTVEHGFYFLRITHSLRDHVVALLKKQEAVEPATEAVQVVRCKDCKHRISCTIYLEAVEADNEDWFCASGARKDSDDDEEV